MCWVLFIPYIYASVFTGDARLDRSDDLGNVAKLNRLGSGALISGNTVQNIVRRHKCGGGVLFELEIFRFFCRSKTQENLKLFKTIII